MDSALINRLLEQRVKDLASRAPVGTVEDRRLSLRKCLGLEPMPERPPVAAEVVGVVSRDGYRIEKLRYESSAGVVVSAQLYIGDGEGRRPVILRPHDHWPAGMRAPVVQAGAISLALAGFACLVVASPGFASDRVDENELNERSGMGSHDDPYLAMGAPVQGRYVWDLICGLDTLSERNDIDHMHVGITGEGTAADTAMYAYAIDGRIGAAVIVAGAESQETHPALGCACRIVPGIVSVGDRADILALRAPAGALMILADDEDEGFPLAGHIRTDERLRKAYRGRGNENRYRFERFFGGHDYNRRMREAALAFFKLHLCGGPDSPICPEVRPLTDGHLNPYPSGTVKSDDPELEVIAPVDRGGKTFRQLLENAVATPYPQAYRVDQRLVTWRKYGALPPIRPGAIFAIHDSTATPREPGSVCIDEAGVDIRLCTLLGLSAAEALAQMFHLALPGGPESWESSSTGISTDPFTSMIASMKTLVTTPEAPPKMVVAAGPVASMVARFLARYRPNLEVQATHLWTSWREAIDEGIAPNAQPLARYLDWI